MSRSSNEEGPSVASVGPLVARTGPPGGIFSPSMCADAEMHTQKREHRGNALSPREERLRLLCQASSARTHADNKPLSDDRPTTETPRPQAGRIQFRRLHARRGLGGAGGVSHRALVPLRSGLAATSLCRGARPARLHARPAGALRPKPRRMLQRGHSSASRPRHGRDCQNVDTRISECIRISEYR